MKGFVPTTRTDFVRFGFFISRTCSRWRTCSFSKTPFISLIGPYGILFDFSNNWSHSERVFSRNLNLFFFKYKTTISDEKRFSTFSIEFLLVAFDWLLEVYYFEINHSSLVPAYEWSISNWIFICQNTIWSCNNFTEQSSLKNWSLAAATTIRSPSWHVNAW